MGTVPFPELTDVAVMFRVMNGGRPTKSASILDSVWTLMLECWEAETQKRPSAAQIVSRLCDPQIGAIPSDAAPDWDPWHTSKFRSSLREHTLFGKIDNWREVSKIGLPPHGCVV
jgi:hypothetical protein